MPKKSITQKIAPIFILKLRLYYWKLVDVKKMSKFRTVSSKSQGLKKNQLEIIIQSQFQKQLKFLFKLMREK